MRYILVDIEGSFEKCENCRFLKFGRCLLGFEKPYAEDRAFQCQKADMTDYIQEVIATQESEQ